MREIFVIILIVGMVALGSAALTEPSSMPSDPKINELYLTKEGFVASTSEELLDVAVKIALTGSTDQFVYYLAVNPLVFLLKPNLWARVKQRSFPGKIQIYLVDYDLTVWTLKEAIE